MVPDLSRTSLGLEYFVWETDGLWSWPDERLIDLGVKECAQLGLIEPDEVEDGTVVRMKKAYPVYDGSYATHVATIRRYLENIENLQTVGRNGQHRYNNQDHSMLTGVYAARNIAGAQYDVWDVNVEEEYHEEVREHARLGQREVRGAGDRLVPMRVSDGSVRDVSTLDEMVEIAFAKLDPVAMGAAAGIVAGLAIFLASAVLLLKGGDVIGPRLSLLGYYLIGFKVTWPGALLGAVEAGIGGFALAYAGAWLRNWCMNAYAFLVKRSAEAKMACDVLG